MLPRTLGGMRYFWRNGQFVNRDGEPMEKPFAGQVCAPQIISDIPDYRSPIDGRPITSRSHRREDLKRNNCVPYEESMSPTKGKFRNKRWAAKHGRQVSEEYRD